MTDQEIEEFMLNYCDLPRGHYEIIDGAVHRLEAWIRFNAKARSLTEMPIKFGEVRSIEGGFLENVERWHFLPLDVHGISFYSCKAITREWFLHLLERPPKYGFIGSREREMTKKEQQQSPTFVEDYRANLERYSCTDYPRLALATLHTYFKNWFHNALGQRQEAPLQAYYAVAKPYTYTVRFSYVGKRYRLRYAFANNRYRLADYIGKVLYEYRRDRDFLALKAAVEGTCFAKYLAAGAAEPAGIPEVIAGF